MKKFTYLILFILALASCEKENLDTEAAKAGDGLEAIGLQASKQSITVIGTGDPVLDVGAVQNAVDNYDKVILSGVFDFGNEGVEITRLDVTLQGPATIQNGGRYFGIPPFAPYWYTLSIRAPGVNILNLEFDGSFDAAIIVLSEEDGRPVVIDGNSFNWAWAAVAAGATKGGLKVVNNTQENGRVFCYALGTEGSTEISNNVIENNHGFYGYYARYTEGSTEISNNVISTRRSGIQIFPFNHKLDITNNIITVGFLDGIWIGSWPVSQGSGPEWGNNPPVSIIDNTIEMLDDFSVGAGIMVGTSAHGINNVLVKGNTLNGVAGYGGLTKQPYGHNNTFINNDLTGLTTDGPQIWTMGGRNNLFQNNKLGIVAPWWSNGGPAFRDAATLVSTINWHINDGGNTPDPVNYNNQFSNNDYSLTGVSGWTGNPDESFGALLLLNFIQLSYFPNDPYEEPFIMENYINENNFPDGTGLCSQVLDLSNLQGDDLVQGNNHIAGWTACEAEAKKETYELVANRYKNLGQYLNNITEEREKYNIEKRD